MELQETARHINKFSQKAVQIRTYHPCSFSVPLLFKNVCARQAIHHICRHHADDVQHMGACQPTTLLTQLFFAIKLCRVF